MDCFVGTILSVALSLRTLVLQVGKPRLYNDNPKTSSLITAAAEATPDLSSSSNLIVPHCTLLHTLCLDDPGVDSNVFCHLPFLQTLHLAIYSAGMRGEAQRRLRSLQGVVSNSLPALEHLVLDNCSDFYIERNCDSLRAVCKSRNIDFRLTGFSADVWCGNWEPEGLHTKARESFTARLPDRLIV